MRCSLENYPLSSLLQMAYEITSYQLSGPAWLDEERFTINAKAPEGTSEKQVTLMLRNLLSERLQIAAHFEERQITGYRLVVAKGGAKLQHAVGPPKQEQDCAKETAWMEIVFRRSDGPAHSAHRARLRRYQRSGDRSLHADAV